MPKMLRFAAIATFLIAGATGALAQGQQQAPVPAFPSMFQGTQQEQAACRGDSQRYCKDDIPDTFRVLACLQKNRQQITVACRRVLESHGQ
jgi:hypothetical protein